MNRNSITPVAAVLIVAFLLSGSGCGSIGARTGIPPENHYPYMGVVADVDMMRPSPCIGIHPGMVIAPIDLPFSFVVDTVLLPVDLIHVLQKDQEDE